MDDNCIDCREDSELEIMSNSFFYGAISGILYSVCVLGSCTPDNLSPKNIQ
jgi:hypothetical protein